MTTRAFARICKELAASAQAALDVAADGGGWPWHSTLGSEGEAFVRDEDGNMLLEAYGNKDRFVVAAYVADAFPGKVLHILRELRETQREVARLKRELRKAVRT
jgi:hypothetical protein